MPQYLPVPQFGSSNAPGTEGWANDLKSSLIKQGDPYGVISEYMDIVNAGGLTPQQRAMLSAAMNRQLGMQAEQAGQATERRSAAQGIAGTGLANAQYGNVLSGLLSAQQQGEQGLNEYGLNLYQNALRALLGETDVANERQAQLEANKGGGFGSFLGGLAGLTAGSILGPAGSAFGSKLGTKLGNKIFGS